MIYNGDLLSLEDIKYIIADYPHLAGVMLGRGLLADPSLALAYKSGIKLSDSEFRERLYCFHDALLQYYSLHYQGGDHQVLIKMKTLWEYLCPDMDRKLRKCILKSRNLDIYRNYVRKY